MHIITQSQLKSIVEGPVPVPVNIKSTAFLSTAKTNTSVPANHSTRVHVDPSTPVDPAPVPTTTTTTVASAFIPKTNTVPDNRPTIFSPVLDPTITNNVSTNPPNHVVPEPDTTTTTYIYANPPTQNTPATDPNATFFYANLST